MANRSDQVARAALADALTFFPKWRDDVARFSMTADRVRGRSDREPMLARCEEIAREIADVRGDLILDLADAPPPVAGHSRVVDIEKALDNIETALRDVKARLEPGTTSRHA
jgi:hypothetical protein